MLVGVDIGYFAHCLTDAARVPEALLDAQYYADIRQPAARRARSASTRSCTWRRFRTIPMGNAYEDVTFDVNYRAGVELARQAKAAGVRSFVFASSCSVYGFADDQPRTERVRGRPADRVREVEGAHRAGAAHAGRPRFPRDLPAVRDRVRHERSAAPGSRAERLRGLRDLEPAHHRAERWHALAAADQRQGHGTRDRVGDRAGRADGGRLPDRQRRQRRVELSGARAGAAPSPTPIHGTEVSINHEAPPDKRSYRVDFSLFRSLAPAHQPQSDLAGTIDALRNGLDGDSVPRREFPQLLLHAAAGARRSAGRAVC